MMNRSIHLLALSMAITLAAASWTTAAGEGTITLQSIVQEEVTTTNAEGEKVVTLTGAESVIPGDVLLYTNIYKNTGVEDADIIILNNAIPEHTDYLEMSAFGEDTQITFSADGGAIFAPIAELTVTGEDGAERRAVASDVTNIRWSRTTPLPPNGEGRVGFRARLQ